MIFGASLVQIGEVHANPPFAVTFFTKIMLVVTFFSQPFWVDNLLDESCL